MALVQAIASKPNCEAQLYAETLRPFSCWSSLAQEVKTPGGTPLSHHRPQIELFAIKIKYWFPKASAW